MDATAPGIAPASARTTAVFLYLGPLSFLVPFVSPAGNMVDVVTSFIVKDQLHATPVELSLFRLATAAPLLLAVAFGLARDRWNLLGRRDRGFFLVFGCLAAGIFAALAGTRITYPAMLIGVAAAMTAMRFVTAAQQGLVALLGQEMRISGRLSVLLNITSLLSSVVGAYAGGWMAQHLAPGQAFAIIAGLTLTIALYGLWKPAEVFEGTYDQPAATGGAIFADVRRLFRDKAVYPPIIIMLMFNFSPGFNTPLQYYLSNQLHSPDTVYGAFFSIFSAAFLPMIFFYGWLCQRMRFERLIWISMALIIPSLLPLALFRTSNELLLFAIPMGTISGLGQAALYDLAIRSCPRGLQGALMMLVDAAFVLSFRVSDILGAQLYQWSPAHGLLYGVVLSSLTYACILPVLRLVPARVLAVIESA